MKKILKKHYSIWPQKAFLFSVVAGLLLLVLSLFVNYWASSYAAENISNAVTDILLDHLPTINVNFFFSEGTIIFLLFVALLLIYEPKRIPFVLKSISLFYLIRSVFIILTHMAPPLNGSYIDAGGIINKLSSGYDLFFSGHTGLPFMLAIIFWNNKTLRYLFIISTIIGATTVILGHLHYSIDVFSALFISFGIVKINQYFFAKDYQLFKNSSAAQNIN